jgi:hypothetical protein
MNARIEALASWTEAGDAVSPAAVSKGKEFSEEKTLAKGRRGNQFKPSSGSGSIAQW